MHTSANHQACTLGQMPCSAQCTTKTCSRQTVRQALCAMLCPVTHMGCSDDLEWCYLGREALRHGRKAQQLMRQRLVNAAGGLLRKEVVERAAGEARQRAKALRSGTAAVGARCARTPSASACMTYLTCLTAPRITQGCMSSPLPAPEQLQAAHCSAAPGMPDR